MNGVPQFNFRVQRDRKDRKDSRGRRVKRVQRVLKDLKARLALQELLALQGKTDEGFLRQ